MKKSILILIVTIGLSSCGTASYLPDELGSVTPRANGLADAYGFGATQQEYSNTSQRYAQTFCSNQNKRVATVSRSTKYQGAIKKEDKAEVDAYAGVIGMMTGRSVSNGGTRLDYKTTLRFRCR